MGLFLSKYTNKIDKKGRVSVPARFRSVLAESGSAMVVLLPTIDGDAINGCGMDVMEGLQQSIGSFNPYSAAQDSEVGVLMTDALELPIDGDGRIVIPLDLLEEVGIEGTCVFAGRGDSFPIWQPEAFEAQMRAAKEQARAKRAQIAKSDQEA